MVAMVAEMMGMWGYMGIWDVVVVIGMQWGCDRDAVGR